MTGMQRFGRPALEAKRSPDKAPAGALAVVSMFYVAQAFSARQIDLRTAVLNWFILVSIHRAAGQCRRAQTISPIPVNRLTGQDSLPAAPGNSVSMMVCELRVNFYWRDVMLKYRIVPTESERERLTALLSKENMPRVSWRVHAFCC